MRNILMIFPSLLILLLSCSQNSSKEEISVEYALVHSINIITYKKQQEFINKLTEAISKVKENNDFKPDTLELLQLLDSAKEINKTRVSTLKNVKQLDNEIRFKDKALTSSLQFDSAYDGPFKECINILASNKPNKLEFINETIIPTLERLQESANIGKQADIDFQRKYDLKVQDK
jgi:hypothetical protein